MDDVVVVGEDEKDLLFVDFLCRQFEAVSGAILNRSHKTAILGLGGLGGWDGRKVWPLAWVSSPVCLKMFGITFAPPWGPPLPSLGRTVWGECRGPSRGGREGGSLF